MAVNEDELAPREPGKRELLNVLRAEAVALQLKHGLERQFGNRGNVCETPVFVLECWEPHFGEARNAGLARVEHPGRLFRVGLEAAEFCPVRAGRTLSLGFYVRLGFECNIRRTHASMGLLCYVYLD